MGDAKRVDEMMRDAANDLAMPQPGPQALAYAQQMLRIGAASIEAAKRVDLDALRLLAPACSPPYAALVRDAIAEIEAARAARPSVASDAGPSRAARLVAYRCAAVSAIVAAEGIDHNLSGHAEDIAHTMLAAEREPQS